MKKKILLALIIVVVLIGAGVAYAYFATDAFKTDKEMFFLHISSGIFSESESEKISEYMKKQEDMAYTNRGEISAKLDGNSDLITDEMKMLNDSKISFDGKINNSKKLAEQTITVDLQQGINIPIKLRRDGEKIGLQSNLLDSKYIAIRNDNLKALFKRFDIDTEEIPDKIDFEKNKFTEEEIQTLKNRYLKILDDNLEEELFSKEKVDDQTVIKLEMTDKKIVDISTKILETLRDDDIILNKISEMVDKDEYQQKIDEEIEEIKDIETDNTNISEVKLYTKGKEINKITIKISSEDNKTIGQCDITKEVNGNDISCTINLKLETEDEEKVELNAKIQYKNILLLDNVEENYKVKISMTDSYDEDANMEISYKNQKTFSSDLEIDGLNSNNATIINNATDEDLEELIMNIYTRLGMY